MIGLALAQSTASSLPSKTDGPKDLLRRTSDTLIRLIRIEGRPSTSACEVLEAEGSGNW